MVAVYVILSSPLSTSADGHFTRLHTRSDGPRERYQADRIE